MPGLGTSAGLHQVAGPGLFQAGGGGGFDHQRGSQGAPSGLAVDQHRGGVEDRGGEGGVLGGDQVGQRPGGVLGRVVRVDEEAVAIAVEPLPDVPPM